MPRVWIRSIVLVAAWQAAASLIGAPQQTAGPPAPRAAAAPVAGSATISGVVVSAEDASKPVRHAIIRLSGGGELNRGAVTDDEGRFAIGLVPAGSYTLTASKPAHLTLAFGAKGPGRPGTSIVVRDGESVAGLRIPLPRGAVITGTVRDSFGEPLRGVEVFAVRASAALTTVQGFSADALVEPITTDDQGVFRIFGLAPGVYIVGATPPLTGPGGTRPDLLILSREQIDAELRALQQRGGNAAAASQPAGVARFNYAPVFHPSSISAEQAAIVTLAAGEERQGVDLSFVLVPTATIQGVVVANGQPASAVALSIGRPGPPLPISSGFEPSLDLRPGADGVFRFSNVAPGTYTITARSTAQVVRTVGNVTTSTGRTTDLPPGTFLWATATVTVSGGGDVRGVVLSLRPGVVVIGRVVFDASVMRPPADLAQVKLWLTPERTVPLLGPNAALMAAARTAGTVLADGAFELKGLVPASYQLSAQVPGGVGPNGWWLRSAVVDGRDLLDRPFVVGDADLTNVTITFSDRHTELNGSLTGANGLPATDLVVIALPEDRALWSAARRIQQARPATNGRFAFSDLPPGTYLIAVVPDEAGENWRTEDFLASIAPAGVKVTIGEGERRVQDLRIGGRHPL